MRNFKLTKVIASSLIIASVLALNPVAANAEWRSDSHGWRYSEYNYYATGWKIIDGKYYYFGKDGYMVPNEIVNTHTLGTDGALIDTKNQTQVEKIKFIYPSNWIKTSLNGKDVYYLDNKGTKATLSLVNMQGKSPENFINDEEANLKAKCSLNSIEGGYVEFNHNKAKVANYNLEYKEKVLTIFDVTFFNNNTAYIFTLFGYDKFSDETLRNFEDQLRTVEFVN